MNDEQLICDLAARAKQLDIVIDFEREARQASEDRLKTRVNELEADRGYTAVRIRAAWAGLDIGQPRGEVMEDLAAIAHDLDVPPELDQGLTKSPDEVIVER